MVASGRFTRLVDYFHEYSKTYEATFQLGVSTSTDDMTGEILREASCSAVSDGDIIRALRSLEGEILQQPPAISAKRVNGERLYDVNRGGAVVAAEPVEVTVHKIKVRKVSLPTIDVEISCGSGTYIRAIARDVGEILGTGGAVRDLRRTRIGPYSVESAVIPDASPEPIAHLRILPERESLSLDSRKLDNLRLGRSIVLRGLDMIPGSLVRIFGDYFQTLECLCMVVDTSTSGDSRLQPVKVFSNGQ